MIGGMTSGIKGIRSCWQPNSPTAVIYTLHDLEGRFKDVNRAGCESLGYHKEELLKLDVRDIDPDAVERSDKERFWKDIVNNEPINFEARHQHKDGSFFPIEVSLNPVQFGAQRLILAITRDISERKAAEEALQESETRYREFVEGTDDLITKADKDGKFIFVNHMSNRIFGLAPQDCIGKLAFGFVHPDDRERTRKWLYEKIATHKIRGIIENRQVSQSGEIHHMLWTANFHYDNDGNLINVNGIARDIANRKQAEEALQKAHVGLEQEVEERTSELSKKNEQLREEIRDRKKTEEILKEREKDLGGKRIRLEELNGALKILLEKRDEDRKELEEKVMVNVKEMVLPYVAKLKSTGLGALQETFTDIIESNLDAIISPFLRKLSSKYLNLTPTEIRVADLVKQGLSTKEIGNLLNSSPETISRHRKSIRKKLQLKDKKSNLRTHLLSLQ